MDENRERVKIRVRVKERIPEEKRRGRRRYDTALWLIATVLLGVCLGYIITDQLLRVLRSPGVEYALPDESVMRASEEKVVLEFEDLLPARTPTPVN